MDKPAFSAKFVSELVAWYSSWLLRRPLRDYQLAPARAIVDSVINRRGLEFAVMFPRQSGKNETQAQVEALLLNYFCVKGGEIVKAQPTFKPQAQNAMRRLETLLAGARFNLGWGKQHGYQFSVLRATMTFLSAGPSANVAGATASLLLECDEAQDVLEAEWDKKFLPMGASTNVTTVYWGTAWTPRTLLARTIRHLREQEALDNIQRVFVVTVDEVRRENPAYGAYVDKQVARLGRQHLLIRTQYFNEEVDGGGGMFPSARRALMRGRQRRQTAPEPGRLYALLLDIAGQDEAAARAGATTSVRLANPGRDATALTVVEVDLSTLEEALIAAPTYRTVFRKLWKGTPHTALFGELRALARHWQARYLVVDSTGIGAGLADFLDKTLRPGTVLPFQFSAATKSQLGWDFMNLVDSGRWQDYELGVGDPDGLTFWQELAFCEHEVLPGPSHLMRWGVPAGARDPESGETVHDDTVISAALATVLDRQVWHVDTGPTHIIRGRDPLEEPGDY